MAAATTKSRFHPQNESSVATGPGGAHKQSRRPRPITEAERAGLEEFLEKVHYSPRYSPLSWTGADADILMMILSTGFVLYKDSGLICRHVMLPKDALKHIPKDYFDTETGTLRLLQEEEWRSLGITQVRLSSRKVGNE